MPMGDFICLGGGGRLVWNNLFLGGAKLHYKVHLANSFSSHPPKSSLTLSLSLLSLCFLAINISWSLCWWSDMALWCGSSHHHHYCWTTWTHLRPYDLDDNTAQMDGLAKQKGRGRHSGRGWKDRGWLFLHRCPRHTVLPECSFFLFLSFVP